MQQHSLMQVVSVNVGLPREVHWKGRTGFYLAVLEEGDIATGDSITLVKRDKHAIPVAEITRLAISDRSDVEALRRVVAL